MSNRSKRRGSQPTQEIEENIVIADEPKTNGQNVTNEVLDSVLDSMPEPSSAADEILKESESESEPTPTPTPTPAAAEIPPVQWISEPVISDGEEPPSSAAKLIDSSGVVFDPNFHCADDSGNPTRTKSGKWRKKKGVTLPPPTSDASAILAASISIVYAVEMLGSAIGGDEWKPEQSEHDLMVNAWRDYMTASGAVSIPPYVGILIATGSYALPRFQRPVTVSRLTKMKEWFIGLYRRVF